MPDTRQNSIRLAAKRTDPVVNGLNDRPSTAAATVCLAQETSGEREGQSFESDSPFLSFGNIERVDIRARIIVPRCGPSFTRDKRSLESRSNEVKRSYLGD